MQTGEKTRLKLLLFLLLKRCCVFVSINRVSDVHRPSVRDLSSGAAASRTHRPQSPYSRLSVYVFMRTY